VHRVLTIELGQVLDGKYKIVRLVGEGGMGAVYEGENTLIHRRVAIKVLNATLAKNTEIVARFEREAQAAGRIGNDHILEVLDLGALADGNRYMVLEYLEGETLLERIRHYGRLEPSRVVPIARQFLDALSAAHQAGVIHRDLKPENIFILREKAGRLDFVKLIDFGVSKFANLGPDTPRFTRAGALIGTPCYLAPEQARGIGEADVRSDIYAVGVILYEAVTGRVPFESDNFNDLLFKIALSDPKRPSEIEASIDAEFEGIVMKAMARDPAARFQSVEELSGAIEDWAAQRGVSLSLMPSRGQRVSSPELVARTSSPKLVLAAETVMAVTRPDNLPVEADAWKESPASIDDDVPDFGAPRASRKRLAVAAAVASVAALGLLVFTLLSSSSSSSVPPAVGLKPPDPVPSSAQDVPPPAPPLVPVVEEPAVSAAASASAPPSKSPVAAAASATAAKPASSASAKPKTGRPKAAPDFGY
jgi:serine/threonine protein kinase